MTDDLINQIKQDYKSGMTAEEMALKYGLTIDQITFAVLEDG